MKYTNETRAAGVHITEASPIDDRLYISTEEEVAVLENVEPLPNIMYDGMIVHFSDTGKNYIWTESVYGLMLSGFLYPDWYDDIQGQNYAGKRYNFVLYDTVAKLTIEYDNIGDPGIFVPKGKLPYNVVQDMDNSSVSFKSSVTDYTEMEFPDRVEVLPQGLMIILDPKPALTETFKITIS